MKLKMNSHVGGTNYLHWSNPWGRDTTRGSGGGTDCVFPTMHSSEMQATVKIAQCECCGVMFGFMDQDQLKSYCPSHKWLEVERPLGKLHLSDIKYPDVYNPEKEITGRLVRYSYFFPEEDPKEQEKLLLGLRVWLQADYLEQVGLDRIPKVVKVEKGVWIVDLQRLQRAEEGVHGQVGAISSQTLQKLMKRMDEVYVESL